MKKLFALLLALCMVFALCACGQQAASQPEESKAPEAETPAENTPAENTEKAPEDYTGKLVVYSPHDADPLNAGVAQFMEKYPNIQVEVIAAGTGVSLPRLPILRATFCGAAVLTPSRPTTITLSRTSAQTTSSSAQHTRIPTATG